jgi:hypothetical protein
MISDDLYKNKQFFDRGSLDRNSLDQNCHFSVDQKFHNHLTEFHLTESLDRIIFS